MSMEELTQPKAIICATCGGDPRRSLNCKSCGGAGIGVASHEGFLVWDEPVDELTSVLRKIRKHVNVGLHLTLLMASFLTLVAFGFGLNSLEAISDVFTLEFWSAGHWYVTLLWLGLFLDCFIIFRLNEYTQDAKPLENWGKTKKQLRDVPTANAGFRFSITPYFSLAGREVVENAYKLSKSLGRIEVTPVALFAAALTSPAGNLFMVRLGMSFEVVKHPLARLLQKDPAGQPPIHLSMDAKRVLALAYADARMQNRKHVGVFEIFLQAFKASQSVQDMLDQLGFPPEHVVQVGEWIRLREKMREEHDRFGALAHLKPDTVMNRSMTARQTPLLDRFSEDLTRLARNGYIPPVMGRERELEEIFRGIESGRRSVAIVGETGVGKSALIEQVARRMVEEDVPEDLFDKRLVSVNVAPLIASGDPGLAAERLLAILDEVRQSGNIVLVLAGIEALTGGNQGGPMDLAEIFATELDRGGLLAIVTTTPQAWTRYIESRSLASKLIKINVPEMDVTQTMQVLMARSAFIEYQNKVFFSFAALEKAAQLASRYIHDKAAPETALDVIREAAVIARKSRGEQTFVSGEDVAKVVQDRTRIPVEAITQNETDKLLSLEQKLHGRVIGQDEAVVAVSQALRRARAELREGKRPIANFLFLGPTGVGKTELTKAIAAEYFGREESMIRLDMSEYQDKSSIARLIGFPGDERGGLVTEAVRKNPFTIVLLDELEKAHPDILTLFLQVMDDGRLTDGVGRTVDFTNVMLIATSNAGTSFIQEQVSAGTPIDQIRTALLERELKGIFRPEFLNRFDGVIVFKPLSQTDVDQIAWLLINGITERLAKKGIQFRAEDEAVEELARQGFDPLFGARPLRRVIQERVDNALADLLLRGGIGRKDTIILKSGGELQVEKAPAI
jgi:ATP-dependent Clp protease ATP-binding subunit ClpC